MNEKLESVNKERARSSSSHRQPTVALKISLHVTVNAIFQIHQAAPRIIESRFNRIHNYPTNSTAPKIPTDF